MGDRPARGSRSGTVLTVAVVATLVVVPFLVVLHLAVSGEQPILYVAVALILLLGVGPLRQWRDEHLRRRRRERGATHGDASASYPCPRCGTTRPAAPMLVLARSGWLAGAATGSAGAIAVMTARGALDAATAQNAVGLGVGVAVTAALLGGGPGALLGAVAQAGARRGAEARHRNWRPCTRPFAAADDVRA